MRERAGDYFEIQRQHESPYMLIVAPVKENQRMVPSADESQTFGIERLKQLRSTIPAVTHVDYSARLQTVDAERNRCCISCLGHLLSRPVARSW